MYTVKHFKNKFNSIPINEFSRGGINPGDKPCALGHCGVDTTVDQFYTLTPEAKALNSLFIKYLYPSLSKHGIFFNTLLLEQGILIFSVNDGVIGQSDKEVFKVLGITHKTPKGRILQALDKIERIQSAEIILTEVVEAVDAEFEVVN